MFTVPEGYPTSDLSAEATHAIMDYTIQPNDFLNIEVFSNKGEKLIDPNPELTNANPSQKEKADKIKYLVTTDGTVKLPLIDKISVEGLTLRQAEMAIQEEFSKFFKDPYVVIDFENKRAILLGATGGQVIPLNNPNTKLTEVLAQGEGLNNFANAQNIRLLRGEEVFLIDLSTVEGYRKGDLLIQPGDIIYVEPIRRPFSEGLRDNAILLSLFVSLASFVVIILKL